MDVFLLAHGFHKRTIGTPSTLLNYYEKPVGNGNLLYVRYQGTFYELGLNTGKPQVVGGVPVADVLITGLTCREPRFMHGGFQRDLIFALTCANDVRRWLTQGDFVRNLVGHNFQMVAYEDQWFTSRKHGYHVYEIRFTTNRTLTMQVCGNTFRFIMDNPTIVDNIECFDSMDELERLFTAFWNQVGFTISRAPTPISPEMVNALSGAETPGIMTDASDA